jgi:hypothetical protein
MSLARGAGWLCLVKILDFHRASDGQARSNPKVRLADHSPIIVASTCNVPQRL